MKNGSHIFKKDTKLKISILKIITFWKMQRDKVTPFLRSLTFCVLPETVYLCPSSDQTQTFL